MREKNPLHILKANIHLLALIYAVIMVSCDDDNLTVNPQMCGVWIAESFEYFYEDGRYSKSDNPIKKMYEFRENGKYREHLYSDYDKRLLSYSEYSWGYDSGSKILQLNGNERYEVLGVTSSNLQLKDIDNSIVYGIYTYRKLSQSECDFYGIRNDSGSSGDVGGSSAAIPTSLVNTYIHFYYDDKSVSDFVVWNINEYGASIEKGLDQVYYTANSGPTYTYSVIGGRKAEYDITFQRWVFVMGTKIVGNPLTRSSVLTFYNNDNSRGTFVQEISGEKEKFTGRFYIGGKTGPGDWGKK